MFEKKPGIFDNEILRQFFDDNPAPRKTEEPAAPAQAAPAPVVHEPAVPAPVQESVEEAAPAVQNSTLSAVQAPVAQTSAPVASAAPEAAEPVPSTEPFAAEVSEPAAVSEASPAAEPVSEAAEETTAEIVSEPEAVSEAEAETERAPRRSRRKKKAKAKKPKIAEPVEPEVPFTFSEELFQKKGRVFSVMNQKGGCGKTTTAINLAAGLAQEGFEVLLIDLDAQANATLGYGVRPAAEDWTMYHIFRNDGSRDVRSVIRKTEVERVSVAPSSKHLSQIAGELLEMKDWEYLLRQFLDTVKEDYHYVVIDCPPSLNALTVNALSASDQIVIPLQTHYFSLEGMKELFLTVRSVQEKLNPLLRNGLILPTLFDKRARINRDMLESIRNYFKDKVLDSVIHTNVKLVESVMHGQPAMTYDPLSRGARDYRALSRELISKDEAFFGPKKDSRWAKFIFHQ